MYESPIQLIESQMRTEVENEIFRAIKEVGVDVNKEELIKALQYDRHQYSKGYKDGYDDGMIAFAEKLKDLYKDYDNNVGAVCKLVLFKDIDNLLKEMVGDNK